MQILPSNILTPNLTEISRLDKFWDKTKYKFNTLPLQKVFLKSAIPAFYIYQIRSGNKTYRGVTGAISIQSYLNGEIKGHEDTIEDKEQRQIELLQERTAQVKPVLLTYPAVPAIEQWIESHIDATPYLQVEVGEHEHTIWKITAPKEMAIIQYLFEQHVHQTYIADGHHRTVATVKYAESVDQSVYLYGALFSSNQIEILPFNRVVEGIENRSIENLMEHLAHWCEISIGQPLKNVEAHHQIKMYVQKKWYYLNWKPELQHNLTNSLDATLLDLGLLKDLMQVDNIRNNKKLEYISGDDPNYKQLQRKVDQHPHKVGFCLPPMSFQLFMNTVNEGHMLPPKSTWFKPRMLNGLLVYELK